MREPCRDRGSARPASRPQRHRRQFGGRSGSPSYPSTSPNRGLPRPCCPAGRASSAVQSSRARATSAWLRPMKFHHMTISSSNGGPPSRIARAGSVSESLVRVRWPKPGSRYPSSARRRTVPAKRSSPVSTSRPCSKAGSTARLTSAPGRRTSSAPSSGVKVRTGEADPAREPRKTLISAPRRSTGAGAWCWKSRGASRWASGRATQSWTPCRTVVSGVETSVWAMPCPPVIRLSSPGRTKAWLPRLSRCSISPVNSQLTVCRPMWGCGATSMPPVSATSSGP